MLDSHNHLHQFSDPDRVIAEMRAAGITGCVVNGTSESDWPDVASLAERHPGFVHPAFGLHPWYVQHRTSSWLDTLCSYLDRFPNATLGECGLDQWVETPSLGEQVDVFLPQLALARERSLPVTIHALKAWQPLLEAFETEVPPSTGFLLHSFGGSAELVDRFTRLGARFSFSGYFLHPRKARILESFRAVEDDRLLLETDAPSMLPPAEVITHPLADSRNHPANLPAVARALAGHLGVTPDSLTRRCDHNSRSFFRLDREA